MTDALNALYQLADKHCEYCMLHAPELNINTVIVYLQDLSTRVVESTEVIYSTGSTTQGLSGCTC